MGIIAYFVLGLAVGLIARFIIPPSMKLGLASTCVLGVLGSFVGGAVLGSLFDPEGRPLELVPGDLILGAVVACIFIFGVGAANSRRAHA